MNLCLHTDLYRISPWVLTAFTALREKKLEFTLKDIALDQGDQRQEEYLSRSLFGKVPVLDHDGFWLSESVAIAEYLAETFPAPNYPRLYPENLWDRARCRQLMMWIRTDLAVLRHERPTTTLFYEAARTACRPLSSECNQAATELVRVATQLVKPGQKTLFEAWCIADVDLGLMLQRLLQNGHPLSKDLQSYAAAQWERPSVKAFLELQRPASPPP
jgi:glutathione S-transferase